MALAASGCGREEAGGLVPLATAFHPSSPAFRICLILLADDGAGTRRKFSKKQLSISYPSSINRVISARLLVCPFARLARPLLPLTRHSLNQSPARSLSRTHPFTHSLIHLTPSITIPPPPSSPPRLVPSQSYPLTGSPRAPRFDRDSSVDSSPLEPIATKAG